MLFDETQTNIRGLEGVFVWLDANIFMFYDIDIKIPHWEYNWLLWKGTQCWPTGATSLDYTGFFLFLTLVKSQKGPNLPQDSNSTPLQNN